MLGHNISQMFKFESYLNKDLNKAIILREILFWNEGGDPNEAQSED